MRKFFMLALMAGAIGMASMGTIGCGGGGSGGSGGGDGGSGAEGGGGSGGGNGGSGGGTTGGTTTPTGGTTTPTGGTTTAQSCEGILENPNDCGLCVIDQCCTELLACQEDAECAGCLAGQGDPAVCDANAQIVAVNDCAAALCSDVCGGGGGAEPACDAPETSPSGGTCVTIGGGNECNPITNEGCDGAAGEACDASQGGFTCYPDGNVHAICEECGANGDYCMGGLTCVGKCARYCCEDTDCGASGKCTKGGFADANVGFCEAI